MQLLIQRGLNSFGELLHTSGSLRWSLQAMLLAVMLTAAIAPFTTLLSYLFAGKKRLEQMTMAITDHLGLTILSGLTALVISGVIIILASFSALASHDIVVGVSVVLSLTIAFGYSGVSLWVTELLKFGKPSLGWVIVGGLLLAMLQVIPIVGPFFAAFFLILGAGAPAVSGYGKSVDWLTRKFQRSSEARGAKF